MNIKFKDIHDILSALCYANAMLDVKIEELDKKGYKECASMLIPKKEEALKAIDSLQKIRKELHLKDDYGYSSVFSKQ